PFEMRRFSIESEEGIDLIVVDSSKKNRGIFGAFDSKYASEFHSLNKWLLIRDCEPYKPVVKEYVLARFEGNWDRGKVEQIIVVPQQQTKYRVMYLDYTNVGDVTEVDIRRYPSDFTVPCSTNLCVIDEFPQNPNAAQVSYLAEVLRVRRLVHIDSVKYLNHIAVIKSGSLIQKLLSL
ncbi:GD20872, partial [Drosophila simulans]